MSRLRLISPHPWWEFKESLSLTEGTQGVVATAPRPSSAWALLHYSKSCLNTNPRIWIFKVGVQFSLHICWPFGWHLSASLATFYTHRVHLGSDNSGIFSMELHQLPRDERFHLPCIHTHGNCIHTHDCKIDWSHWRVNKWQKYFDSKNHVLAFSCIPSLLPKRL